MDRRKEIKSSTHQGNAVTGGGCIARAEQFIALAEPYKAAKAYEAGGWFNAAAKQYEKIHQWREAARMYHYNGFFHMAARHYLHEGELDKARDMGHRCVEHGRYVEAGEIYRGTGDLAAAAEMFTQGGWFLEAGNILLDLGRLEAAAAAYEAGQLFGEAARLHIELGAFGEARRMAKRCIDASDRETARRILTELVARAPAAAEAQLIEDQDNDIG